jgi:cell division protein ZapB
MYLSTLLEVDMSLELFNQLEQKITDTVEALELMKLENEELRSENTQLSQEREEWERRLQGVLSKFEGLDDVSAP